MLEDQFDREVGHADKRIVADHEAVREAIEPHRVAVRRADDLGSAPHGHGITPMLVVLLTSHKVCGSACLPNTGDSRLSKRCFLKNATVRSPGDGVNQPPGCRR